LDFVKLVMGEVDVEQPWKGIESAIEDCEFVEREVNGREGDNAWTMFLIRKLIESVVMNDESLQKSQREESQTTSWKEEREEREGEKGGGRERGGRGGRNLQLCQGIKVRREDKKIIL
jgi:hypothetical protein